MSPEDRAIILLGSPEMDFHLTLAYFFNKNNMLKKASTMNALTDKYAQWGNRTAVAITGSDKGIAIELHERMTRRGWVITKTTDSCESAFRELQTGKASFLIIDDTATLPLALVLRKQINHPVASLTPTLAFCREVNYRDIECLGSIGMPEILQLPVTPSKFIESFELMVRRWLTPQFAEIRIAAQKIIIGQNQLAIKLLNRLASSQNFMPVIVPTLALYLREQEQYQTSEKILLKAVKQFPKSMGVILALVDFYLASAMPEMALKLLNSVKSSYNHPKVLYYDFAQAHLMLNQAELALTYLEKLFEDGVMKETMRDYLARIYYAEGRMGEFKEIIGNNPTLFIKFEKSWKKDILGSDDTRKVPA